MIPCAAGRVRAGLVAIGARDGTYAGKSIVVTGASSGIGRALCLALARQRPRLVLAARDAAALEEVAEECRGAGRGGAGRAHRRHRPRGRGRLVEHRGEAFGGLDVLVNNAGVSMMARFDEVTDLSVFERLMHVNYLGCVYPTHHALPHLKKSRGQIVADGQPGRPHRACPRGRATRPANTRCSASSTRCASSCAGTRRRRDRGGPRLRGVRDPPPLRRARTAGRWARAPCRKSKIMTTEECARPHRARHGEAAAPGHPVRAAGGGAGSCACWPPASSTASPPEPCAKGG